MPILLESEYHLVEYDAERDLVVIHRTATPMPSPEDGIEAFDRLLRALQRYAGKPLLIDIRRVRGNNDARYETAIQPFLSRLRSLFPVHARLVQTATGRLQVQRQARERGETSISVFSDEAEALAYLEANRPPEPATPRSSRPPSSRSLK